MISDKLKAAITRFVPALIHLKAEGANAIPTAHISDVTAIRTVAAQVHTAPRDPQIIAAENFVINLIEKALEDDAPQVPAPDPIPVAPPVPPAAAEPLPELGDPSAVTIVHGGVSTEPQP